MKILIVNKGGEEEGRREEIIGKIRRRSRRAYVVIERKDKREIEK